MTDPQPDVVAVHAHCMDALAAERDALAAEVVDLRSQLVALRHVVVEAAYRLQMTIVDPPTTP